MIAEIAYAALLLGVVPALGVMSGRAMKQSPEGLDSRAFMTSACVSLGVLLVVTLTALYFSGREVKVAPADRGASAAVAAAALAVSLVGAWIKWKTETAEEREKSLGQAPGTPRLLGVWIGMSALAGVTEEIAYRGLLHGIVSEWFGSWWLGAMVCSAAFAVPHVYQGRIAAGITGAMAMGFHACVYFTDSLGAAIVVHGVHNAVMGIAGYRMVMRRRAAGDAAVEDGKRKSGSGPGRGSEETVGVM